MKRIIDGIYLLSNFQTRQYLHLTNGEWDHGQVRTSARSNEPPRLGHTENSQRWLIANVPGTSDYQIINLHYGVLIGKLPGQRWDDWTVKAGVVGMEEMGCRWFVEDISDGCIRFLWRMDSTRALGVRRDVTDAPVQILPRINHATQYFRIYPSESTDTRATWLSHVPSTTPLTMLNIPGTHQSLSPHGLGRIPGIADFAQGPDTVEYPPVWKLPSYQRLLYGGDNPRCQNRAPLEQLCDGVRYLDLSFDRWTANKDDSGTLYARHGVASLGYTLAAVLQSLKVFLRKYAGETVILQVRNETHCEGFEEAWESDAKYFEDLFYKPKQQGFRAATLGLGDVRGRIVCPAMAWGERTSIFSIGLGPRSPADVRYAYIVEDTFDLELNDTEKKVELCRSNMERARRDRNSKHWYKTAFNMSIFSKYNPIDAVYKLKDDVERIFSPEDLGVNGEHRIGIICFDFYEYCEEAVENIIASNRCS